MEFRRIDMLLKKENASDKDWEIFKSWHSIIFYACIVIFITICIFSANILTLFLTIQQFSMPFTALKNTTEYDYNKIPQRKMGGNFFSHGYVFLFQR